ncbi:2-hydroxyacyl-CoA dehydratase [Candidatus Poribacteria bacterium]|nr:2-hydroxyacyl-CoA dehydratase [Candidatus Poribacteria bacterium]
MEWLRYFTETASPLKNPEIIAWKEAGKRIIGTVCSNIPEEVLHAAGLLPVRLRAPGLHDTSNADSQLHRINCSYTRSILEELLRGDLEFLDGIITTNTCDHMLRLAGEIQDQAGVFVHYFSMYHTLGNAAAEWFVREMERLIARVEESFGVEVAERNLRQSIAVYNRTRELMAGINELRKKDPPAVSGAEYLRIVLSGMSGPKERFNDRIEALLPELRNRRAGEAGLPRLMIVGGACDCPEFIDFIERKGASIVADALCFGARHYLGTIKEDSASPLRAIADRYISRPACPSIIDGFEHSYRILRQFIQDWRVQGIICARLKFCDHWGGARKMLADELRKEGIPLLDLEREYAATGSGQINTRVQAFLEMLRG